MERTEKVEQAAASTPAGPAVDPAQAVGRLRAIVESQPACLSEVAHDGRLLAMNQAHLALVGTERLAEVVGSDFGSLVAPADRERVSRFIKHVADGHGQALEYSMMRGDGRVTDVCSDAVPLDRGPGTTAAALIVTRDITEQRALEGKLRAAEQRHQQSVTGHAVERERLEQALRDAEAKILESPDIKVGRSQRTGSTCAVSPAHLSSSNNHRLNALRRLLAAAEQAPQPERGLRRRPSTEARKYCSGRSQKNP